MIIIISIIFSSRTRLLIGDYASFATKFRVLNHFYFYATLTVVLLQKTYGNQFYGVHPPTRVKSKLKQSRKWVQRSDRTDFRVTTVFNRRLLSAALSQQFLISRISHYDNASSVSCIYTSVQQFDT